MTHSPRRLLILFLLLVPLLHAEAAGRSERDIEASLLHRQYPLESVAVYSRATQTWEPLRSRSSQGRPLIWVVNLWSKSCLPCLEEMPEFRKHIELTHRKLGSAVRFLFVADPPEQTSAEDVVRFWQKPFVDGLADKCPEGELRTPMRRDGVASCLIKVPDVDPARSQTDEVSRSLGELRPLTLLVDREGTIRQVIAGSVLSRPNVLQEAVEQLLSAIKRPVSSSGHSASSR